MLKSIATTIAHALAVLVIACLLFVMSGSFSSLTMLASALGDLQVWMMVGTEVTIMLLIATALWMALLAIKPDRDRTTRTFKVSKGSTMLEFLIVFPVFMLFLMGLSQLTINNTASILTSLGAFQGGRAVFIWEPESRIDPTSRRFTSRREVESRARAAASLALAPVVPTNYTGSGAGISYTPRCNTSDFDAAIDAIYRQLGSSFTSSGVIGADERRHDMTSTFDGQLSFRARAMLKLPMAWCFTDVRFSYSGSQVTTTVRYEHENQFGLVARIFTGADKENIHGRDGYFTTLTASYTMPIQRTPNTEDPLP